MSSSKSGGRRFLARCGRCRSLPAAECVTLTGWTEAQGRQTTDTVFRRILRKPNFTWAEHGEALLRRRKPWYYEQEPRPGTSVIGARLTELVSRP